MESYLFNLFKNAVTQLLQEAGADSSTIPSMFKDSDISSTKFADFQYNGVIRIYQKLKQLGQQAKSESVVTLDAVSKQLIQRVFEQDQPNSLIATMALSKNFINIFLNDAFILKSVLSYGEHLVLNGPQKFNLLSETNTSACDQNKKQIIVDYSSPNVAKSLHIGHLRSTIIGESIVRILKNAGHDVIGLNHIGDWGTQFGMIINLLKKNYVDHNELMLFLQTATSEDLMTVYRDAKQAFDASSTFADESREQTHKLQQNDDVNKQIWKEICKISSNEYSKIYDTLNIRNLVERGESFYQSVIPDVLELLKQGGFLKEEKGATIIMLENWTYPLMVVKSDGGYTYDTTDLAALYHRLCVMDADKVIYITDAGQKSHFDMCFEVAKKIGWTKRTGNDTRISEKQLVHIGFGLVCGKDGKKLKTRSGDVVKMLDVIDEVVGLSKKVIVDRAKSVTESVGTPDESEFNPTAVYYQNITDEDVDAMSRKIGINTLKYFDLSHSFETNYKYDPELMFRFNGDTGVYLMYCFARINGIIEKSQIAKEYGIVMKNSVSSRKIFEIISPIVGEDVDQKYFTKETRDLMIHVINFGSYLDSAVNELNSTKLTTYVYNLCTYFNTFITQKNGKIIGSSNEKIGIALCVAVSKIIESIFNLLSFEPVDHI